MAVFMMKDADTSFLMLLMYIACENSRQIPDHRIFFLDNASWRWFLNEILHFPFLQCISWK